MEEKILRELLAITKENNEILKTLNLQRRWSLFFWVFKWLMIAGIAYSAYLAASPYIQQAQATIDGIQSFNTQVQGINQDSKNFTDFLKNEIEKRIK